MADYTNPVTAAARTIYADTVLAELPKLTHPIAGFATDLSAETAKPGTTIDCDFAVAGEVKTTFPGYTGFATAAKAVKVDLDTDLSAGFTLDEARLMQRGALYVQEQARLNIAAVLNSLLASIATEATGSRATQSLQLAKDAPFDADALRLVYAELIKRGIDPTQTCLALCGADYAQLAVSLPYNMVGKADNAIATGDIGSALGLKSIIVAPSLASNGFAAARSGLVVATRAVPSTLATPSGLFRRQYVKDPVTGLTVTLTEAFDTDTGATTFSVRLLAGFQVCDPKAIVKITRASA